MVNLLTFLKNNGLFNDLLSLVNKALKLYQIVDPVTSSGTIPILQLILEFFIDAENTMKTETTEDAIRKIKELMSNFSNEIDSIKKEIDEMKKKVNQLIPEICLIFDCQEWNFVNSKGISSITDLSANTIQINFIKNLINYNQYFVHCNLSGAICDIQESHVILELPENYSFKNIPIRIYMQKIFID